MDFAQNTMSHFQVVLPMQLILLMIMKVAEKLKQDCMEKITYLHIFFSEIKYLPQKGGAHMHFN